MVKVRAKMMMTVGLLGAAMMLPLNAAMADQVGHVGHHGHVGHVESAPARVEPPSVPPWAHAVDRRLLRLPGDKRMIEV